MNSHYALGLFLAFLVVAIWTAASFFTQYLQTNLHFKGVFLFTYISCSLFSLNFIVWYLTRNIDTSSLLNRKSAKYSSNSLYPHDVNSYKTLEESENPIAHHHQGASTLNANEVIEFIEDNDNIIVDTDNISKLKNPSINRNVCDNISFTVDVSANPYSQISDVDIGGDRCRNSNSRIVPGEEEGPGESSPSKGGSGEGGGRCSSYLISIPFFKWLVQPIPSNYNHKELLLTSLLLMPLWFIGNFFYNYSLLYTSIGSSMVITELNGALTLIISYLFGVENITLSKLFGVILSFGGVVLVSLGDSEGSKEGSLGRSVYGDIMAFIGAVGYGLYTTFLKIKIPDDSKIENSRNAIPTTLLFGYFGLAACIVFFPVIIYFISTNTGGVSGITPFIFGYIFVEEIFDAVLANYLYAKATILTTPTVTAVSITMTVPCAIVSDWLYAGIVPSTSQVIGALLVTIGVIVVTIDNNSFWSKAKRCFTRGL